MKKVYTEEDLYELNEELRESESKQEFLILSYRQSYFSTRESFVKAIRGLQDQIVGLQKRVINLEMQIQEIQERKEEKEIEFRVISENEAKKVIERYTSEHPGCTTSEIIENLKLDPALVVEVLNLLEEEGKVRGEEVG